MKSFFKKMIKLKKKKEGGRGGVITSFSKIQQMKTIILIFINYLDTEL